MALALALAMALAMAMAMAMAMSMAMAMAMANIFFNYKKKNELRNMKSKEQFKNKYIGYTFGIMLLLFMVACFISSFYYPIGGEGTFDNITYNVTITSACPGTEFCVFEKSLPYAFTLLVLALIFGVIFHLWYTDEKV